jgi:hypothetical protein
MRIVWKMALVVTAAMLPAGAGLSGAAGKAANPACRVNAECVLVAEDCCGCTGGGKQKAIPRKDKDSYERARQARCAGTLCPAIMSQDRSCSASFAICKEGQCTLGS